MTIPTSTNLPWKPEEIKITEKSGNFLNPEQIEYFRFLIKALNSMYADIANEINILSGFLTTSASTGQEYLRVKADDGTYIYVYPKKDGEHYTLTATPVEP